MEVFSTTDNRNDPLNPIYEAGYLAVDILCPKCGYLLGSIMNDNYSTVYAPNNYCGFCGQKINNNVLNYLHERKLKNENRK